MNQRRFGGHCAAGRNGALLCVALPEMQPETRMPGSFLTAPWELIMKTVARVGLGALLAAVSISTAFAQPQARPNDPSAPKTRADVRADLIEWRAAGYDPLDWIDYPENAQRAGRIVAARRAQQAGETMTQ
jgi:hypothetical protein